MNEQAEQPIAETPEDVAILYSWANLHGAKYRDFSASRREYRAQVRHRLAEETRQAELQAQAEAEAAAAEAERKAREAERAARASERYESPIDRDRALREAEEAARRASAERVEAARRAEAAAIAEAAARREEREIAEAHASAERQTARWNDSEIRHRSLAGPQPGRTPSAAGDPYEVSQGATVDGTLASPNEALEYTQPQKYRGDALWIEPNRTDFSRTEPSRPDQPRPDLRPLRSLEPDARRSRAGFRPDQPSGIRAAYRAPSPDAPVRSRINSGSDFQRITPLPAGPAALGSFSAPGAPAAPSPGRVVPQDASASLAATSPDPNAPAWLLGNDPPPPPARSPSQSGQMSIADTLQSSRERVASRWFALKGVFDEGQDQPASGVARARELRTPLLAVFSLAGGVGKTSMVATLGRALSSLGEKVLLADTTSHGLLPYYFGATELKPGVVRTFSPPSGSTDAPIHLVSYDVDESSAKSAQQALADELTTSAGGVQRMLVDFNAGSGWLMRRLTSPSATVLVPLAPDMNSVISLSTLERYFNGAADPGGRPLQPFYLLNQFDPSLPLHLDVREVLRRQLGDRLLPFVIRRSPAVSEALAEGMTVIDYQPEGAISEDYLNVARWLRSVSLPAGPGVRTNRWSER